MTGEKRRTRVLIVDDDPRNVMLLEAIVAPMDLEVLTAGGGREALEVIAKESPDIILMDIRMPEVDGISVCRQMKEEFHRHIFEKFAFYEARKKTGLKGIGMGLPFCRSALRELRGDIEVESPLPGRSDGVCMRIFLPLA